MAAQRNSGADPCGTDRLRGSGDLRQGRRGAYHSHGGRACRFRHWAAAGDDTPAQEPEEPENELIEAALLASFHRLDNVTVTHYCICQQCCGKAPDHPAYGITASGRRATPYVSVAVDPSVIPLGADVLVDYGDGEIHYYRADDTGSGVDGRHIDLCVGSHAEALRMGVKTATVYWVAQEK